MTVPTYDDAVKYTADFNIWDSMEPPSGQVATDVHLESHRFNDGHFRNNSLSRAQFSSEVGRQIESVSKEKSMKFWIRKCTSNICTFPST